YTIAVWRGGLPDDPPSARVLVRRFSWLTAEVTVEDVTIDELALRLVPGSVTTIRFQAELPVTGAFDILLASAGMRVRQWVATGPAVAFLGESAAETTYGPGQLAGGQTGLVTEALWGIRGHGLVRAR
ncbi:MAG TPA: hypothetical protein VM841_07105, partial [Actinomycetota bacterium]|nr:hypothetical protein [Actinomycetota bacterium]